MRWPAKFRAPACTISNTEPTKGPDTERKQRQRASSRAQVASVGDVCRRQPGSSSARPHAHMPPCPLVAHPPPLMCSPGASPAGSFSSCCASIMVQSPPGIHGAAWHGSSSAWHDPCAGGQVGRRAGGQVGSKLQVSAAGRQGGSRLQVSRSSGGEARGRGGGDDILPRAHLVLTSPHRLGSSPEP